MNKVPLMLERRNKKLSILYEIALTVGKSLDLKAIIDDVLDKIMAFMGVDAGVIYVINEDTQEMTPIAFRNLSDAVVKDLSENKVKVGECMCGSIAHCGREVIVGEKAYLDPRFTRKVLERENMEFYAGLPLKARNKVVGVLCAITHTPYIPDEELLDILRAATQPIGLAIENARGEEALQKARDELEARVKERTAELLAANEKLHQRHLEASVLYKVSSVISRSIRMDELIKEVLNAILRLGLFTIGKGGIFIVQGDRMKMAANVGHSAAFVDLHKDMKVGDCLCGIVAKTGEILISGNSAKDSRHTIVDSHAAAHGHLVIPLKTKDRVEGVLDLYMPVDAEIDEDKVKLLSSIGQQLGIAIENARLYEETKALSLRDSLTGLWNHEEILRILVQELARAEREGTCVVVIMADLDHFKGINDTYGHMTGDAVLRLAAERMVSMVRPYDAVGRYGGEEFMIVLPACDEGCDEAVAERLRRCIADKAMETREGMISVTISIGMARTCVVKKGDINYLVKAADNALYRAKRNGRNRVEDAADTEPEGVNMPE